MQESERPIWRNWSREQVCEPESVFRPLTREGLVKAITEANSRGARVKVPGSGHSFTEAALTDGVMIDITSLKRILEVDTRAGTARVEAGVILGDLNPKLDSHGLAFANLGDIDRQTLAGSISTATHGTGERFQNVSAQLREVELIGADGTTHRLNAESDPDGFRAARVGIGALGAIYAVTLDCVPSYRIDRTDQARPLDETLANLDDHVSAHDHFELYVFPHAEQAVCRESARTQAEPEPRHPARVFAQEVMIENWIGGAMIGLARRLPRSIPLLSKTATFGVSGERKLDKSYEVFASERRIKFTEMEYAIPREYAREAVQRVLAIAEKPEHQVSFPIEVRFVKADDAFLSPSFERDACYIAVHHDRKLDWRSYFAEVEAVYRDYGGRPHWGKRHSLTHRELSELYPRWEDFKAVRRRLDPDGRFANGYTERVLGPVG